MNTYLILLLYDHNRSILFCSTESEQEKNRRIRKGMLTDMRIESQTDRKQTDRLKDRRTSTGRRMTRNSPELKWVFI